MAFKISEVPQADRLEKVIDTVEAIAFGANSDIKIAEEIGFTDRQGRYYRHAAELLGFIKNERNNAVLTPLGELLISYNDFEKRTLIKRTLYKNELFKSIITFFQNNNNGVNEQQLKEYVITLLDSDSPDTVQRRTKTILSWLEYLDIILEDDELYRINDMTSGIFEEEESDSIMDNSLYPPNYKQKIDINEDRFSVYELVRKIKNNKILMNPDFQRNVVWKPYQKSQFIESIILNIPLPPFYYRQELNGNYIIVDGLQRTSTLNDFLNSKFALGGLSSLPNFNGLYFQDLPVEIKSRIEDKVLLIYALNPNVPMKVVYDIFNRINTGGTILERQEIRNCIFTGKSTSLIKELADSDIFKKAIDQGIQPTRMKDREAILRYLAFKLFNYEKDYYGSIDDILERTMLKINVMGSEEIDRIRKDFYHVMNLTFEFFNIYNFRLPTYSSRGRINIAILESVGNYFSNESVNFLTTHKEKIKSNYFTKLLHDENYLDSVRFSTGSTKRVITRFKLAKQILGDV